MATAPDPDRVADPVLTEDDIRPAPLHLLELSFGVGEFRRTLVLDFDELGPGDDLITRKATGLPVSAFMGETKFGNDSFLILWWTARRKNGEPGLTLAEVAAPYQTNRDLDAANPVGAYLTEDEVDDPNR